MIETVAFTAGAMVPLAAALLVRLVKRQLAQRRTIGLEFRLPNGMVKKVEIAQYSFGHDLEKAVNETLYPDRPVANRATAF